MSEDCLYTDVYAPSNATMTSNLPIMVFIQGGGWTSDSNGNFNGSLLVQNSGMAMVVVTINYRVGLLGALASKEVLAGASVNNGLKDGVHLTISSAENILILPNSDVCIAMGTRSCRFGT
jgi:carboxylesterase type B